MSIQQVVDELVAKTSARLTTPLGLVALAAVQMLEESRMPSGARRRMSDEQAASAIVTCTRLVRRAGLQPLAVCREAAVVTDANEVFRFLLTSKEMNEAGELTAELNPKRTVRKDLRPYVRIVQAVARLTEQEELPLLDELGAAVSGYLEPFDEAPLARHEEIASDLLSFGPYFSKPRKGTDGEPVDLAEWASTSLRLGLAFSQRDGTMFKVPDDTVDLFGHEPHVRLLMRRVASGTGDVLRHERNSGGIPAFKTAVLGRVPFQLHEVVSLSLVRERGAIRAVLVAEPWTRVMEMPGSPKSASGAPPFHLWAEGAPIGGSISVVHAGERLGLLGSGGIEFHCPLYKQFIKGMEEEIRELGGWPIDQMVCTPRRVELDPETLGVYLEDRAADALRQDFAYRTQFNPAAAADVPPWAYGYAVPALLPQPDGTMVEGLADRLEESLYRDGSAIMSAMLEEVTKRVRALDAHVEQHTTVRQGQKARFRRLMRS